MRHSYMVSMLILDTLLSVIEGALGKCMQNCSGEEMVALAILNKSFLIFTHIYKN